MREGDDAEAPGWREADIVEVKTTGMAIWHGKEYDQQVEVTHVAGSYEGEQFYGIKGSGTGIPESELEFLAEPN